MILKRSFDIFLSVFLLILFSIPLLIIIILIKITDPGPAIHWSKRVGKKNILFKMPKFRSMKMATPQIATHLMTNPEQYVTSVGKVLRRTSLDELPQLWSIFIGEMSFVGPRPALYNQDDLVELRTSKGIHELTPGLTGWAQINGRDELSIPDKVGFDFYYLQNQSILLDIKILVATFFKSLNSENITH